MVSALMTALQATKIYGRDYAHRDGNWVHLQNTSGKPVEVSLDQLVYMRGNRHFGIFDDIRDSHRKSQGYEPDTFTGKTGIGDHRQEHDIHKSRKPLSKPARGRGTDDRSIYE